MPRSSRKRSESDVYHVMVRGEGRRILFEDEEDRQVFLQLLSHAIDAYGASSYAWCCMSNHVHMLVKVPFDVLPRMMQSVTGGYAIHFNKKYDHVGHVFGGRYNSKPVEDDEYLLQVVRYIHLNPIEDGLAKTCEYKWSSYNDYLNGTGFVDTEFVLGVIGGIGPFREYHERAEAVKPVRPDAPRSRLSDADALEIAKETLSEAKLKALGSCGKDERDEGIASLRRAGLSARQVERFTGISRGIVERVKWK